MKTELKNINDTKIIPSKDLPKVLVEEIKGYMQPLYPSVYEAWERSVEHSEIEMVSLQKLIQYFTSLVTGPGITIMLIRYHLQMFGGAVIDTIVESIIEDQQKIENDNPDDSKSKNIELAYLSMEKDFQIIRDMVTKKNHYKETKPDVFRAFSNDDDGTINAYAEVRKTDFEVHQLQTKEETDQWLSLVAQTLTSLDEWTADLFDMICFCWSSQEKDQDGYIEFHSDDALQFKYRNALKDATFEYRERERFDIMRRVAALTNVWISLRGDEIQIIGGNKRDKENDEYDFTEFKRMFEINSVKIAQDKRTGESKGIYALTIKPAPLLRKYIDDERYTLGAMDLKVFEYSHFRQRDHKRLTRYLSYLWKARNSNNKLAQPILISTLLEAIDLPKGYSGSEIRDRLESVLDDLQQDGIIREWSYQTPINESLVGKKGWVTKYWSNLTLLISPPERIIMENNKEILMPPKIIREPNTNQLMLPLDGYETLEEIKSIEKYKTNEEILNYIRDVLENEKLSLRKVSSQIGISHSTLMNCLDGKRTRMKQLTIDKMKNWILQRDEKSDFN